MPLFLQVLDDASSPSFQEIFLHIVVTTCRHKKHKLSMMLSIYRVARDFILILQDLIPEAIPSQKCHMNMGLIWNGYGATDRN
jgi:hypothetical protein